MKKQLILGAAAVSSVMLFTACDGSKKVAESYLNAKEIQSSPYEEKTFTAGDHQGKSFAITKKEKSGNEVIYTYDVMKADGSVEKKDQVVVVFKDKNTSKWLVDVKRSAEEAAKREKDK